MTPAMVRNAVRLAGYRHADHVPQCMGPRPARRDNAAGFLRLRLAAGRTGDAESWFGEQGHNGKIDVSSRR
jgi:hypothetical protein